MGDERALAAMVESIRKHGYLAHWPILMWRGEILDGRLRAKACEILGVIPTVVAFDGSEAEAAAAWQERHTSRRTMSDDEVVELVLTARPREQRAQSAAALVELTGVDVAEAAARHKVTPADVEKARHARGEGLSL